MMNLFFSGTIGALLGFFYNYIFTFSIHLAYANNSTVRKTLASVIMYYFLRYGILLLLLTLPVVMLKVHTIIFAVLFVMTFCYCVLKRVGTL